MREIDYNWFFWVLILVVAFFFWQFGQTYGLSSTFQSWYPSEQCKDVPFSSMKEINVALGSSMFPTIPPGSTVYGIEYNPQKKLVPGDIVVVRPEGVKNGYIHRITGSYDITKGYVFTKGDGNRLRDEETANVTDIKMVACGVLYN